MFKSGSISCSSEELSLKLTLYDGQSYRWRELPSAEWIGVFNGRIWTLSQDSKHLFYRVLIGNHRNVNSSPVLPIVESEYFRTNSNDEKCYQTKYENELQNYFRLDVHNEELYKLWSKADPYFREIAENFKGVRILNQDLTEIIFSFICSSNTTISRTYKMFNHLCNTYGTTIATVEGISFSNFPSLAVLAEEKVEVELKEAGFGYRAPYVRKAAEKMIELGGREWLHQLQKIPYEQAKKELIKLPGVGPKVADCICLLGLGHLQAVPVDTHIFQIAKRQYLPHLRQYKTVSNQVYREISDHFQKLYGDYAGWGIVVLFCADLRIFKNLYSTSSSKSKEKCHLMEQKITYFTSTQSKRMKPRKILKS